VIRVYWNFHKKCYSVQHKWPQGWRLAYHSDGLRMSNARFVVSQAGRERVIRQGRKNVHAFIVGERDDLADFPPPWLSVVYNPRRHSQFHSVLLDADVHAAKIVDLSIADGDTGLHPVILCSQGRDFDVVSQQLQLEGVS